MVLSGETDTIALRPTTPVDSDFAFNVRKAAFSQYIRAAFGHWDDDEQRATHGQRFQPAATRIILSHGQDVGYVAVRAEGDGMHLLQFFLLPEAQGRGIGSHVLSQVLAEARQQRRLVFLRVLKSNPRARAFYERHGFAVAGETATHYLMEVRP